METTVEQRIKDLEINIRIKSEELDRLKLIKPLKPGAYLADHRFAGKDCLVIISENETAIEIGVTGNKVELIEVDIKGKAGDKADISDYINFRKLDLKNMLYAVRKDYLGIK